MTLTIAHSTVARQVAHHLLELGAVRLSPDEPFTWASGWKSPIYCDNRQTLSDPEARSFLADALSDLCRNEHADAQAIAGVATAGIPHAALIADRLELPMIYVRSKAKEHGLGRQVEGKVVPGQRVVVVEDLISTGMSSLQACDSLKAAGLEVVGLIALFTYGFPETYQAIEAAGIPTRCLCDYEIMLEEAQREQYIDASVLPTLQAWRESPGTWGR